MAESIEDPHLNSIDILSMSLLDLEKNQLSKKNPLQIPELLTAILNNLELTRELIPLRLINVQWKSVIESICSQKVHCLLFCPFEQMLNEKFLLDRFFGAIKLQHSVALRFRFDEQFCRFLGDLFPNVDQLIVRKLPSIPDNVHEMLQKYLPNVTTYSLGGDRFWSSSVGSRQVATLHWPIKWHLKRLDIDLYLDCNLSIVQSNIEQFDQLQHFSSFQNACTLDTLPLLGSKCIHYWFRCDELTVSSIQRWIEHCSSKSNLARVTRLGLSWISNDLEVLIPLICAKFEFLQMLDLGWNRRRYGLFNRNACAQLAKLTHLRTLRIRRAELDPTSLKGVIVPLESVRVLHLLEAAFTRATRVDANCCLIWHTLATIFPNLEELAIYTTNIYFQESFQNNLSLFTKLRHFRMFSTEFDF